MKKRITSLLLVLTMLLTLIPSSVVNVLASGDGTGTLLMSLTRTSATAAESGNVFTADSGVFAGVSELSAWDANNQITIGGTGRTPIVINNAALTGEAPNNGWKAASVVGIDNASAFQIKFSTLGYDDIRFSASQKSTGSGPDTYKLAYRIGSSGSFTPIDESTVMPVRVSNDSYDALVQTYDNFVLPAAVDNQDEVYLRVYFDGITTLGKSGNTSINDIRISSGVVESEEPEKDVRPDHIIINQVYGRALTSASSVSNGFIELYNPTNASIDMSGMSLQYFMGSDRGAPYAENWEVLPLTGQTIHPNSSFLIISDMDYDTSGARYTIDNHDIAWNIPFSNRAFSVALVDGTAALTGNTETNTLDKNVIDLVGVTNTVASGDRAAFYEIQSYDGISNQYAARRKDFADYNENNNDFERYDYRESGINNDLLDAIRPRWSGDGAWGADIFPIFRVPASRQLEFSKTSGFYGDAFSLMLSTAFKDAVIRYTVDGSEPTAESTVYSNPIQIENRSNQPNVLGNLAPRQDGNPPDLLTKGTVVRAKVFDKNDKELTSKTHTHSYFIGLGNKYEGFPIISLSTDNDNLFDPAKGIYYPPAQAGESHHSPDANYEQRGVDWERPVHFEIIEPDGRTHSQDMGMRINGGWTRRFAQKSLRLYARGSYDADNPTLKYDVFDGNAVNVKGEPITEFQRILLRNGGNDNYGAMMRDPLLQSNADGLKVSGQAYRQSIVFINGEFWGYYNIRERIDEYYYRDKFDLDDRKNVGFFSFTGSALPEELVEEPDNPDIQNDYASYTEMWDWFHAIKGNMTDSQYVQACKYLDIDNFIDYWVYNMAIGQGDWPENNLNMWRYRTDFPDTPEVTTYADGRWRYNFKDLDFAFNLHGNSEHLANFNRVMTLDIPQTVFIQKLMTNESFKERFIERTNEIVEEYLDPSRVTSKIDAFEAKIAPVMDEHNRRWGRWWSTGSVDVLRDFVSNRQAQFLGQIHAYFKGTEGKVNSLNISENELKEYADNYGTDNLQNAGSPTLAYINGQGLRISGRSETWDSIDLKVGRLLPGNYILEVDFASASTTPLRFTIEEPESPYHDLVTSSSPATNATLTYNLKIVNNGGASRVQTDNGVFDRLRLATGDSTGDYFIKGIRVFEPTPPTPEIRTVTFNANNGTVSPTSRDVISGDAIGTLPTPTRTGYAFVGWFDTSAATGGTQITATTVITESRVIYARWTAKTFTLTFDKTSGTGGSGNQLVTFDQQIPANIIPPSRNGYSFAGYFDELNGKGTPYYDANGSRAFTANWSLTSNLTLYAHWEMIDGPWIINSYVINFNRNGGTLAVASRTRTLNHGEAIGNLPTPKRSGYVFAGWFTAKKGGTKITSAKKITSDTTFYAQWIKIPGKPTSIKATANSKTRITVSWKKAAGATGYEVWRGTSKKGKYKLITNITKGKTVKFKNKKLKANKKYFYKIRAYVKINGKKVYSKYTAPVSARTKR